MSVKEKVYETPQGSPVEGLHAANCADFTASMPEECVDLAAASPAAGFRCRPVKRRVNA
jgi:hypothetical protein